MFSFSNDLKRYKKSHSAILIFGQLWLDSGPLWDGANFILPVVLVTDDMVEHTGFILPASHGVSLANSSALDLLALLLMLALNSPFVSPL